MTKTGKPYTYRKLSTKRFTGFDMIRFARYVANKDIPIFEASELLRGWFDGPSGDRGRTIWEKK